MGALGFVHLQRDFESTNCCRQKCLPGEAAACDGWRLFFFRVVREPFDRDVRYSIVTKTVMTMDKEELMQKVGKAVHDERVALKAKMCDLISHTELCEETKTELCAAVSAAVDDAFEYGKLAGMKPEDADKMYELVNGFLSRVFGKTEEGRAGKYQQLYYLQRLVSDNLRNALSYSESIASVNECNEKEGILPAIGCMGVSSCP